MAFFPNFLRANPFLGLERVHIFLLSSIPVEPDWRNKPRISKSTELRDQSVSQSVSLKSILGFVDALRRMLRETEDRIVIKRD